jgi:drug/metabolite transporter (DMT)-like permease
MGRLSVDIIKSKQATIWVILSLIGSSIEPLVVKYAHQNGFLSSQLMSLKLIMGGICFLPFLWKLERPSKGQLKQIFLISFLAMLTNYSIFLAVEKIPVTVVITLISTTPVFIGIIHTFKGKVILKKQFWPSLFTVLLGVMLSVRNGGGLNSGELSVLGVLFVLSAIMGSILYRLRVDELCNEVMPIQISTYMFTINGILGLFFLPFVQEPKLEILPFVVWLGLAGAVANIGFIFAIHVLGATKTSVISLLQRPMIIVLAAFFFKESLDELQVIGIVFVILGVWFAKSEKTPVPQTLTSK